MQKGITAERAIALKIILESDTVPNDFLATLPHC
jgi:hypothetical protein